MKYHKKEIIYCLSDRDRVDLIRKGTDLKFDPEVNNYFWILESVAETDPNFFEVKLEDWLKVVDLGYLGENDIREIIEWMEFEYKISYTRHPYRGAMIDGRSRDLLESYIVLNNEELTHFISISVPNRDERSKYILMKDVLDTMLFFFEVHDGKVFGPHPSIFERTVKGKSEWT